MRQTILFGLLFICGTNFSFAQNGIKIHVENLKPPTDTLQEKNYNSALEDIVQATYGLNTRKYDFSIDNEHSTIHQTLISDSFQYNFIATSKVDKPLTISTSHAFYDAIFEAYANHRPLVLSPDMIWLLIAQGFAQHVNNNAEKLRHYFVQHEGKISLIVRNDSIQLDNPNSPWDEAFANFNNQIGAYTGKELIDVLTNNFSTSTPATKVASQITVMESMKTYFEYVVMRVACGIPDIVLEGTPQDWENLRMKAQYLKKYDLAWWIDTLDPILKKIVATSKGKTNTAFWRNIFKYHSGKGCIEPSVSNGWIVKFFPYNKNGQRNNLNSITGSGILPSEIVNVPLSFITMYGDGTATTDSLELWAGFVGSSQSKENFALKPEIGWMIRKKDSLDNSNMRNSQNREKNADKDFVNKIKPQDTANYPNNNVNYPIALRVNEFPKPFLQIPHIKNLELNFTDSINIPDEIKEIKIDKLSLIGKITEEEMLRIAHLLPNTELWFNGTQFTIH